METSSSFGIELRDVSHSYIIERDGQEIRFPAISNVTLNVARGEFVAVVGPSGCGKTTVLNLLTGLVAVDSGTVLIGGTTPRAGRLDIAYMLARDCLLPWRTALSNAAFGMELRGVSKEVRLATARSLLSQTGLVGFEHAYVSQLSQGMRQRVALARTFALESEYLLMDEPFAAVDPQTKIALEQQLLSLWESDPRRTVVFITHDLGEAIILADRVVVFSRQPGRIKADIRVPLKRPRTAAQLLQSADYHSLFADLWRQLEDEMLERSTDDVWGTRGG